MRSDRALRACMQALVLLNLAFVQMTGAAGLHWLVPLYGLALAAPLLARFRERLAYRMAWNAGVVGFSLLLLRHALAADLAYVLEDGLVLAVLCQVHLLNNLRSSQRPDLLFFNAFLIAIVTGYLDQGLGFPLAFLAFAPCFVVGLQLQNATRDGRVLSADATRRMVLDGGRRAAVVLALSLLVFLFWPRDFQRKAFFHGRLQSRASRPEELEVGFSEKLELNRSGPVEASDREALRVTLLEGRAADVPALWRGATLGATSGGGWHAIEHDVRRAAGASDEPWERRPGRLSRPRPMHQAEPTRVAVLRLEQGTERLFAPLGATAIELASLNAGALLRPRLDGTAETDETGDVRYEVTLPRAVPPDLGGAPRAELPPALAPYVELPESASLARARELADGLASALPADADQHLVVARVEDYLVRNHAYLAPGSEGAARSLDEFLRGEAGGHCEFFASALATMLRGLGIPCRVVTGFRSTRSEGRVLTFAMRDAHAWVEVSDPRAGWYAVDPSPTLVVADGEASLWARVRASAGDLWASVTGFDSERRASAFAWVRALPGRALGALRERPLEAGGVLSVVALALTALVRRRRSRTPRPVRAYREAVRSAGLAPAPGETPRELLRRARRELAAERLDALEAATRRHERERYAA